MALDYVKVMKHVNALQSMLDRRVKPDPRSGKEVRSFDGRKWYYVKPFRSSFSSGDEHRKRERRAKGNAA